VKLTAVHVEQLARLDRGEDVKSSDRPTDRARSKLKRLGLIEFNRSTWLWLITDAGRAALAEQKDRTNG